MGHARPGGTIIFPEEADFLRQTRGLERTLEMGRRPGGRLCPQNANGLEEGRGAGTFQAGKSQCAILRVQPRTRSAPEGELQGVSPATAPSPGQVRQMSECLASRLTTWLRVSALPR